MLSCLIDYCATGLRPSPWQFDPLKALTWRYRNQSSSERLERRTSTASAQIMRHSGTNVARNVERSQSAQQIRPEPPGKNGPACVYEISQGRS
jgi:hypothetical protein